MMFAKSAIFLILLIAIFNSELCSSCHSKEKKFRVPYDLWMLDAIHMVVFRQQSLLHEDKRDKVSKQYKTLYSDKVFKNEYQWEEMKTDRTKIVDEETTRAYSQVSRSVAETETINQEAQINSENCDGQSPCIALSVANDRYKTCCKNSKLSNECQKLCGYDISSAEIQRAFATLKCPIKALKEIMTCASGQKSNQECCNKQNLLNGVTAVCKPFCNPKGHKWPSTLTEMMKFAPCLDINNRILKCHWASLKP